MVEPVGKKALWGGRVATAIPVLMLLVSAAFKLGGGAQMLKDWARLGYPVAALSPIGVVEVACAVLYAVPRTSALGAVLVTGYLGGAIATHVRVQEPVWPGPLLLGVLAWLGLYLRDPRLRALLPFRQPGR